MHTASTMMTHIYIGFMNFLAKVTQKLLQTETIPQSQSIRGQNSGVTMAVGTDFGLAPLQYDDALFILQFHEPLCNSY
jgi:hypothetical protein